MQQRPQITTSGRDPPKSHTPKPKPHLNQLLLGAAPSSRYVELCLRLRLFKAAGLILTVYVFLGSPADPHGNLKEHEGQ